MTTTTVDPFDEPVWKPGDRVRDRHTDVWFLGEDGRWHITPGTPGYTFEDIKELFGPLIPLPDLHIPAMEPMRPRTAGADR